jgi:hypothetical protein
MSLISELRPLGCLARVLLKPKVAVFIVKGTQTILSGSSCPGRHVRELRCHNQILCETLAFGMDRLAPLTQMALKAVHHPKGIPGAVQEARWRSNSEYNEIPV